MSTSPLITYRPSRVDKNGERPVIFQIQDTLSDFSASIFCSIGKFCEEVVGLSAREVYAAKYTAERNGEHHCQIRNWKFNWIYMHELREMMLANNICLYSQMSHYNLSVNIDSNKALDVKMRKLLGQDYTKFARKV